LRLVTAVVKQQPGVMAFLATLMPLWVSLMMSLVPCMPRFCKSPRNCLTQTHLNAKYFTLAKWNVCQWCEYSKSE
jgi:hypothetical protein